MWGLKQIEIHSLLKYGATGVVPTAPRGDPLVVGIHPGRIGTLRARP